MQDWSLKHKVTLMFAVFAAYFPVALYLKSSYVPARLPAGMVAELKRPFSKFGADGLEWYVAVPHLNEFADGDDNGTRSPYVVYEDNLLLGPAHSLATDISTLGHGRFLHWKKWGFIFSSSDGSNAATNGRHYRVVFPEKIEQTSSNE